MELLARCVEARIDVRIIYTRRTPEEQADCVRRGTSRTMHSMHLSGRAMDICPGIFLMEKDWAPEDPLWLRLGELGERIGLRWGGRWRRPDRPHFEEKS